MIEYRRQNYAGAAQLWVEGAAVSSSLSAASLRVWQAKALLNAGDAAGAAPILQQLAIDFEDDYPGVRALSLLGNQHTIPRASAETIVDLAPEFDWLTAETWLTNFAGRLISDDTSSTEQRWVRAQELWLVGHDEYGDDEIFGLIEALAGDPIAMYTISPPR